MPSATESAAPIDEIELPSMMATLCSYESWLGPYHPQTLALTVQIAIAYWRVGEPNRARPLLERTIRDLGRHLGPGHDLRMWAMSALREILVAQRDYGRAGEVQGEILECRIQCLGREHPETLAARADLAMILLQQINADTKAV